MTTMVQALVLLAAAVIAVPLIRRAGFSSVLGYLVAGVAIGPWLLGLVRGVDEILHFSELGVVMLLFIIGLELQPARLWALRRPIFGMGIVQLALTTIVIALFGRLLGLPAPAALLAGFGLALSSTAFVLQILAERKQLGTTQGRAAFSILLFQDLAVIPVLVLLHLFYEPGHGEGTWQSIAVAIAVVAALLLGGRYLLRPLFRMVASLGVPETFTAAALLIVLGAGLALQSVGLSMSLGAFLAGVLLADSAYRHELQASIEPFEGLLLGLFFVAVGMSVNLGLVLAHPLRVVGLTLALLLVKGIILFVVGKAFRMPARSARALAFTLPQGGEFAFVLFGAAAGYGLLSRDTADLLILIVAFSMALTPFLTMFNERVLARLAVPAPAPEFDRIEEDEHPVIIAGFGRFGQVVARILRTRKIPFTALEISAEQVDFVRRYGSKIYYGDASKLELLRAAKADRAKIFVLAIDDVEASLRTAEMVRRHFPNLMIYARARNRRHVHLLMELGVKYIVRETLLSSMDLSAKVLSGLGVAEREVARTLEIFRVHDDATLKRQLEVFRDESRLIQTAQEAARELESLFEADKAAEEAHAAPSILVEAQKRAGK
ncbi:MAG TPA: monovalent cation:proton antiporter-2 (CPA2) family protein [Gammaproteobacteria bacterium]|nr:monovalent cation:proton antiporter-2 (CPA2) family protein [Gammaproteobacteria bacterium]